VYPSTVCSNFSDVEAP